MFEIHNKNTYEEYLRAMQSIEAARRQFYKLPGRSLAGKYILLTVSLIIEAFSIYFAVAENNEWFSAFSVFLGMMICMFIWMIFTAKERVKKAYSTKQAEKTVFDIWNSDKQMRDCDETFRFDEDGIEVKRSFGSIKTGYDCVYRLVETDTNLYIMLSLNRYINIKKENCTVEQYEFIIAHCSSEQLPAVKV